MEKILIDFIKERLQQNEYKESIESHSKNSYEYGLLSGYESALEEILELLNKSDK